MSDDRGHLRLVSGRREPVLAPTAWQMVTTILAGNVALAAVLFSAVQLFGGR